MRIIAALFLFFIGSAISKPINEDILTDIINICDGGTSNFEGDRLIWNANTTAISVQDVILIRFKTSSFSKRTGDPVGEVIFWSNPKKTQSIYVSVRDNEPDLINWARYTVHARCSPGGCAYQRNTWSKEYIEKGPFEITEVTLISCSSEQKARSFAQALSKAINVKIIN